MFSTSFSTLRRFNRIHLRIARNIFLVSIFVGVAKLAGAVKEMTIAYHFGTTSIVDAYVLAFTWVNWLPSVWIGVAVFVIVPLISTAQLDENQEFFREILGLSILVGLLISIVAFSIFPKFFSLIAKDQPATLHKTTILLFHNLAPIAALATLSGSLFAVLLSREKHLNTLIESLPSLTILIVLLFWPHLPLKTTPEITPLIIGTLLGFFLMTFSLGIYILTTGYHLIPKFTFSSQKWKNFWRSAFFVFISQLVLGLFSPFDQALVSGLGEGSVAVLSYTTRLTALVLGLTALAVGRSIFPVLTSIPERSIYKARRLTYQWSIFVFASGLMIALVGWFTSHFIVKTLFERGAFTSQDTEQVAFLFKYSLWQVPFYLSNIVLSYFVASRGQYSSMTIIAIATFTVKIIISFLFISQIGLPTAIFSTVIAYSVSCSLYVLQISYFAKRSNTTRQTETFHA